MTFGKYHVQQFSSINHFIVKFAHFYGVSMFGNFSSKQLALLINKYHLSILTSLSCPLNPSGDFWWFSMCFFVYFVLYLTFSAPKTHKICSDINEFNTNYLIMDKNVSMTVKSMRKWCQFGVVHFWCWYTEFLLVTWPLMSHFVPVCMLGK